jgi:hypothetical protein
MNQSIEALRKVLEEEAEKSRLMVRSSAERHLAQFQSDMQESLETIKDPEMRKIMEQFGTQSLEDMRKVFDVMERTCSEQNQQIVRNFPHN